MKPHNTRALRLARLAVEALPGGATDLHPVFQQAGDGVPERIALLSPSRGAAHSVSVLASEDGLCLLNREFESRTFDSGFVVERQLSASTGRRFTFDDQADADAFVSALAKAVADAPDAFEPTQGPGRGVNGTSALMDHVARYAVIALEAERPGSGVTLTFNDPPLVPGRDVIRFVTPDGEPVGMGLRIGRAYAIEAFDTASGETLAASDDLQAYRTLQSSVDALLLERAPPPPSPAP